MKSRLWKQTTVVAAMALTGALVTGYGRTASARLIASPSGEDESFRGGRVLVGTWRVKVQTLQLRNPCQHWESVLVPAYI